MGKFFKKTKKDFINELLIDPVTYQYNKDDRRNSSNDSEITTSKTTDQLSGMVDQPEDRYYNRSYGSFFFFEEETSLKTEEILKTKKINDIFENNDDVEEKVVDIINSITEDLNEKEKFELVKEIIDKLKIKELDNELITKLITHLKKNDKVL